MNQGHDEPQPDLAAGLQTLNFKVPSAFKKQYKGYAVARGISMLDLLKEGFELSKEKWRP